MYLGNLIRTSSGAQIVDEKPDPLMSSEDTNLLIARLRIADKETERQIHEKLIKGHMTLAMAISTNYARLTHMHGPELYSEALFALTVATMRLDATAPNCNYRAYVRRYIHGYLQVYISRNKTILSSPNRAVLLPDVEEYDPEKHDPPNEEEKLVDKFERLLGQAGLTDLESKVITLFMTGLAETIIGEKLGFSQTHVRNMRIAASVKLRIALESES